MSNIEAYEQNLSVRLEELKTGDSAYNLHMLAIHEAIIFVSKIRGIERKLRILDCGCGLGFLTARLARFNMDVVGSDPSITTIELAHRQHPQVEFIQTPTELLPLVF